MSNQSQDIDKLNKQIADLRAQLGKKMETPFDAKDLVKAQEALKGLEATAESVHSTFGDLTATLKNIISEISKSDSATKDATKSYRGLISNAQKLQHEEEGIYDYNVKQLKNIQDQTKSQASNLKQAMNRMTHEEKIGMFGQNYLETLEDQLKTESILLAKIQSRLELEQKVEKTVGATGALLTSTNKLLGALGFGHMSSEIDDLNKKLKDELREEIKKAGNDVDTVALKFKYMGKAAAGSAKIFADGLMQPEFLIGKIFDTYLKINKASVDTIHLTGQNAVAAASWGANYASAVDYLETINELTKKTGMNAQNIFSEKVVGQAAALKTTMGLTADEAGGLAIMSQTSGKEVNKIVESVVATTSAFNGANRAAVSQGVVLREVANTSNSIKLSLGNNDVALTKAAAAATRLGLSLQDVDNIAASLTDFQSSISNELEAELLIGKDLNLEKARELALSNDLEGVSKELFKNSADINEFGKMNRIQQESYAKALGMTKDQLAKIAYNKSLELGMTEEQAEAAAGVEASEMKRIAAQENFAKALEKIAGAVAPILDIVGDILSMPLVPYILIGVAAVTKLRGSLTGVAKGFGGMYKAGKDAVLGVADLFKKGGLTSAISKLKGAFGEGTGDMVKSKSGKLFSKDSPQGKMISNLSGKTSEASEAAKKIPEKSGGGMSSITDSIQKIKPTQLLAGAAALVLVAGAVYIFAKAAQEFATVSWEDMAKAGVGLLGLVGALALVGAIMMSGVGALAILAGAAAIVIMAGGLFILGKALQEVGQGMQMMEPALALVSSIGDKAAGLATVGASLLSIAGGLREIAAAGTGAIPVLDKLNALGGSASVGEAKAKGGEGSMAAVEAKLDALIAAVKAGGNVYMDSNKVGRAQVLGSYKSA